MNRATADTLLKYCQLLVLVRLSQAVNLQQCGPDKPLVVEENNNNYKIICENARIKSDVTWTVTRTFSDNSVDNSYGGCLDGVSECSSDFALMTFSRPNSSVSIATITEVKRLSFGITSITCMDYITGGTRSNTSCNLDIIYKANVSSCNIEAVPNESTWNLTGFCNITKVFSTYDRYTCHLWQNKSSSSGKEVVSIPYSPTLDTNIPPYAHGSCSYSLPLPTDSATYIFTVIVFPGDTINTAGTITIARPLQPPSISCTMLMFPYVREKGDLSCTCTALDLGKPEGRLIGYYGGQRLNASNFGDKYLNFEKRNLNRTDDGTPVKCILDWVTQDTNDMSTNFTLRVAYRPNVLNFQINNADKMAVNVQEKSSVDVKCLCNGRPTSSIRLINATGPEQLLNQSQTTSVSVDEQGEVSFRIEKVPCEASGVYRCDVNNSLGEDSQSRTLLVYCAPRNADFEGNRPTVNTTNSRGEFSFKLTAYPIPMVQKLIYLGINESSDGHPAKENSITVDCSGRWLAPSKVTCTIRVINITYQDEGFYRLVLTNSIGDMSFTFSVKQAVLEEDEITATSTKSDDKTIIAVLGVLLAVVIVITVIFVVWMWRRGWILPCAGDSFNERQQNQINGDKSDQRLSPATSDACTPREGQGAPQYDALQMHEVGSRSHYEEIQRYQNVVSDTSRIEKI